MTLIEIVRKELDAVFKLKSVQDGVRVPTHNIYPSNSFVQVIVRGGETSFYVSDEGGAVHEAESAGAEIINPDKLLRTIALQHGLRIEKGVIKSDFVDASSIPVVIAAVSNASRECADFLFHHARIKIQRDIKKLISDYLYKTFDDRLLRDHTVIGKSNKPHKFDSIVRLVSGKRLIVDPVIYQSNAINSHVIANLDVANAKYPDIEQRIIYDDEENWRTEDLNLLQVGATVVPFSRAPDVINRIAGSA